MVSAANSALNNKYSPLQYIHLEQNFYANSGHELKFPNMAATKP